MERCMTSKSLKISSSPLKKTRIQTSPDTLSDNHGGGGGLRVLDIQGIFEATPVPPSEIGHFGTGETQQLDVVGNVVYFTERWQGLWAVTFDSATASSTWPVEQLRLLDGDTTGIEVASVDGRTLAWVGNRSQMHVLDVTNLAQVRELAVQDLPSSAVVQTSEALPLMWSSHFMYGMTGWWAAPTMDGTVTGGGTSDLQPGRGDLHLCQ